MPRLGLALLLLAIAVTPAAGQAREGFLQRPHGVQLYYRVVGHGADTLVYLHGGPGGTLSERLIEGHAPLFANHTVVFYQQRGSGRSTPGTEDSLISAAQHVRDLDALRQALGLQRLTLYGVSWGGGLAALYAAEYPDRVARLIQVNPMPLRRTDLSSNALIRARLDSAAQRALNDALHQYSQSPDSSTCRTLYGLIVQVHTVPGPNRDSAIAEACRYPSRPSPQERAARASELLVYRRTIQSLGDWDLASRLRVVHAPALIIHGDADFLPLETVQAYAQVYPAGRYLVIPNARHSLPGDNPLAFFAALEIFLSGGWPDGAQAIDE